jgi:soluble lytic murein transglycosylase-like protein
LRRISIAILASASLYSTTCVPGAAAPSPRAAQYYAQRDKIRVSTGITPQQLQLRGRQLANNVVEVKGVITGSARRQSGGTVVVRSIDPDAEYLLEVGADIPESLLDIGQNVRVLCKVEPVAGSEQAELRAIAAVTEAEALQVDAERAARAAAEQQAAEARRRARAPQLASRGGTHRAVARRGAGAGNLSEAQILDAYRSAVMHFNRRISADQAGRIARNIIVYSNRYGLDARLVMAVIAVESNFNSEAISRAGAMGLGQLMPGTAAGLGVYDPFNPEANVEGSTRLLRGHLDNMSRRSGVVSERELKLALACYNAGAGAVKKHKGIPPYRETQNYVRKVTRLYYQLCGYE